MRNPRANLPDRDGWQTQRNAIPRNHGLLMAIVRVVVLITVASIAYAVWP